VKIEGLAAIRREQPPMPDRVERPKPFVRSRLDVLEEELKDIEERMKALQQ
jgi:hypothetical protein